MNSARFHVRGLSQAHWTSRHPRTLPTCCLSDLINSVAEALARVRLGIHRVRPTSVPVYRRTGTNNLQWIIVTWTLQSFFTHAIRLDQNDKVDKRVCNISLFWFNFQPTICTQVIWALFSVPSHKTKFTGFHMFYSRKPLRSSSCAVVILSELKVNLEATSVLKKTRVSYSSAYKMMHMSKPLMLVVSALTVIHDHVVHANVLANLRFKDNKRMWFPLASYIIRVSWLVTSFDRTHVKLRYDGLACIAPKIKGWEMLCSKFCCVYLRFHDIHLLCQKKKAYSLRLLPLQ